MPTSRKIKNMKKSSKSQKRSKNIRRNKKTKKHLKKMIGGFFSREIELFIEPYMASINQLNFNKERGYIENIINYMGKPGEVTQPTDLMNYFSETSNINNFKNFINTNNKLEFDNYINFINYVLDKKYGVNIPPNISILMDQWMIPEIPEDPEI
jgi:hypothetical protein